MHFIDEFIPNRYDVCFGFALRFYSPPPQPHKNGFRYYWSNYKDKENTQDSLTVANPLGSPARSEEQEVGMGGWAGQEET